MSYQLPYFGTLDTKELKEYYDVEIEMGGHELTLDVNFDEESISVQKLDQLKVRLETLPVVLEQAKKAVKESFERDGEAMEYITNHLDLISAPELQEALQRVDVKLSAEGKLFSLVAPVRIGLYPEDEENYFTIDFSLDRELTQYLIVVVMNVDEELRYITMES